MNFFNKTLAFIIAFSSIFITTALETTSSVALFALSIPSNAIAQPLEIEQVPEVETLPVVEKVIDEPDITTEQPDPEHNDPSIRIKPGYEWVYGYVSTTYEVNDEILRIIGAESSFDPEAKNPTCCAEGLFQITDGSWKTYAQKVFGDEWIDKNKLDIDDNMKVGLWMYYNEGNHHWDESRHNWDI